VHRLCGVLASRECGRHPGAAEREVRAHGEALAAKPALEVHPDAEKHLELELIGRPPLAPRQGGDAENERPSWVAKMGRSPASRASGASILVARAR